MTLLEFLSLLQGKLDSDVKYPNLGMSKDIKITSPNGDHQVMSIYQDDNNCVCIDITDENGEDR